MNKRYRWSNLVIGVGLALVLFSAPHLIDDFLYGIPEEFGLTNQQTQVLAGIFHTQLIVFFVLAARERKAGYYGEKPESVQPLRGWQSLAVGMNGKAEGFLGRQLSRAFPLGISPAQSAREIHRLLFLGCVSGLGRYPETSA
jgi:hypothetical protein